MRRHLRSAVAVSIGAAAGLAAWATLATIGPWVRRLPDLLLQNAAAGAALGGAFGLVTGAVDNVSEGAPRAGWSGATAGLAGGLASGAVGGVLGVQAFSVAGRWLSIFVLLLAIGAALGAEEAVRVRSVRRTAAGALGGVLAAAIGATVFWITPAAGPGVAGSLAAYGVAFGLATSVLERRTVWGTLRPLDNAGADVLLCGRQFVHPGEIPLRIWRIGTVYAIARTSADSPLLLNGREVSEAVISHGDTIWSGNASYRFSVGPPR